MKIAIIGAGAAGLMAAIQTKRLNKKVKIDIFDINSAIGKKILASGNGRCNISNTHISEANYIGEDSSFVSYCLKEFDYKAFEKFCKSIALHLDIKQSSKVYPLSNEAKSVVNLLENEILKEDINLILQTKIIDIEKNEDKFILKSEIKEYANYDKVLISSGLGAAPQLNATELGLDLAQKFDHSYNLTYPSLVGLHTNFEYKSKMQGVKKEANVSLYIDGVKECEIFGDVLFTKYGLSGFAILDISQYAVLALNFYQDVQISLNLFPNKNRNDLISILENIFKSQQTSKAKLLLCGIVSNKLASILLQVNKIDEDTLAKDINLKQIRSIVNTLINWRFKITDTQGFKHAEASGGGIRTSEIDNKTFESKKCKNLFFAGEVLDIVGNRGGFNLHFAWASGYTVAKSLANK